MRWGSLRSTHPKSFSKQYEGKIMTHEIKESVGKVGKNNVDDVVIVQSLLLQQGFSIGTADGQCGRRTIAGITSFQANFLKYPDGLVEPGGKTLQRLNVIGARPQNTTMIAPKVTSHHDVKKTVKSEVVDPLLILDNISDLGELNVGLSCVDNAYMIRTLGNPRENYSQLDQPVTNKELKKLLYETATNVGPFGVRGLKLAVESLKEIMKDVQAQYPDVYTALSSDGMLVCRYQRDSTTKISLHAWGIAIDLKLRNTGDKRGDNKALHGLSLIAPIFNKHKWCWGAAFKKEDAMHFEVSKNLMDEWFP